MDCSSGPLSGRKKIRVTFGLNEQTRAWAGRGRTIMVAFPAFIGLAAISDDAIPLVFGENWRASAPTLHISSVLGALYTVSILHGTLRPTWHYTFELRTPQMQILCGFLSRPLARSVKDGLDARAVRHFPQEPLVSLMKEEHRH